MAQGTGHTFHNVRYIDLDENGEPIGTEDPGIVWNGGLKAKFFGKAEGLHLEGIKISHKKAEELGDLKPSDYNSVFSILSNYSQIWENKTDRANRETELSLSTETRPPGEAALYLWLPWHRKIHNSSTSGQKSWSGSKNDILDNLLVL